MPFQIFYATSGIGLSEGNSKTSTISSGTKNFGLTIPSGNYDKLRYDIGNTAGLTYTISKIICQRKITSAGLSTTIFSETIDASGNETGSFIVNSTKVDKVLFAGESTIKNISLNGYLITN